ncbi:MAG: YibE/F family protein [Synergistaceae bacterium]|jgi:uncharacterized membrane protein|nr:YibE/F family protein [Synergistaceae bacterium]
MTRPFEKDATLSGAPEKKRSAGLNYAGYPLRLVMAAAAAMLVYFSADSHILKNWNTEESLVVEAVDVGETRVTSDEDQGDRNPFRTMETELALLLLTGEKRGQTFNIVVTQMEGSGIEFGRGGRYILLFDAFDGGAVQYSIADAYRVPSVVGFIVFICGALMALAGRSGVRALAGLLLSIIILLWGYIPLVASGKPPMPLAFLAVLLIAAVTVFSVVRRKQARLVALLGTLGGAAGAFALGCLMVMLWRLTGLSAENAALLATTMPGIDIRGILLSSVIISAIGAVLDVGISITASMSELVEYDPAIPPLTLWTSGIRVGGEVLGSMINTLILAYLGTSLPIAILICNAGPSWIGLLNDPYVGQEILQSLAGTSGLLLTIPITATLFVFQEKLFRRAVEENAENG